MFTRRAFLIASMGAMACGHRLRDFPFDGGVGEGGRGLLVRYVGVGCFWMELFGVGVLTDPFWSHLPLGKVAFGRIAPDPAQIEPHLPPLKNVQAVVVGHGHYDHVLDLPYVIDKLHPQAKVIGSRTLRHTFAPLQLSRPIVDVNSQAANPERLGEPVLLAGGRLRIRPILSGHPTQYAGFHLFKKSLTVDRTTPPTRARHFQEGMTLAYLIDWLRSDGTVMARVYVQTSSTGAPAGFFPASLLEEAPVDVALLAMDCANQKAKGRATVMDFLQPRAVIFCHWEDFFRPKTRPPREIVKVNLPKLKARVPSTENMHVYFPRWDAQFLFHNSRMVNPADL